jgi:hypothetical protein
MPVRMMKRTNIYLDPAQLKILKKIGKPEGGTDAAKNWSRATPYSPTELGEQG